ncbi:hypothetical protein SERLA73DRAFT_183366 [Serpula lacrymans var. lacrymans S7.3]|uniref:Uncharacterized protein n=2 Tax=Serpula lacrymans var. lacrymans TaxID=341189 RepID=F8PZR6_SERL3|nr:uncharacterized protein SERLADRAFT_470457 [Serpula lacrymans var. lacrymans S7.9]EGN98388.1 hypothetical protein SERLA73DRAFT_183366 [Serpula lacrymans var. lacrymans S7.3]EGO23940.1 hypothetical protein SERLADRAFT_470457 [Serpula lacrymans var. lacrymans S7.9]
MRGDLGPTPLLAHSAVTLDPSAGTQIFHYMSLPRNMYTLSSDFPSCLSAPDFFRWSNGGRGLNCRKTTFQLEQGIKISTRRISTVVLYSRSLHEPRTAFSRIKHRRPGAMPIQISPSIKIYRSQFNERRLLSVKHWLSIFRA